MELYRERSYARCIAEGWGFLGKNLWKVIKIMSPWYVVCAFLYAIVNACSIYLNVAEMHVLYTSMLLSRQKLRRRWNMYM